MTAQQVRPLDFYSKGDGCKEEIQRAGLYFNFLIHSLDYWGGGFQRKKERR